MAVEIYLEAELEEMINSPEVTKEWKKLATELGMEGQLELITPKANEKEDKNPSPYTFMNKKYERIFAILCPETIAYQKYNKSTIPREVLKEIALAEKNKYFDAIKIWYDDASPDPVVVGYIKTGAYDYVKHMIARFGDEVLPIEELEIKAINRFANITKRKLQSELNSIDAKIHDFFNPSTYGSDNLSFSIEGVKYGHRKGD